MLKFVFLLTVWSGDVPQVSVVDYGISGEDCIEALTAYMEADPEQSQGAGSCEIDSGEPWDELPSSGVFN